MAENAAATGYDSSRMKWQRKDVQSEEKAVFGAAIARPAGVGSSEAVKEETSRQRKQPAAKRFAGKAVSNPMVWLGVGLSYVSLVMGIKSMVEGDRWMSQRMMRMRVGTHCFALSSVVGTVFYYAWRQSEEMKKPAAPVPVFKGLEPLPPVDPNDRSSW